MARDLTSMNASEYVTALYQLVLQRQPEAEGLEYWSKQIETGVDPKEVLATFLRSDEYRQKYGGSFYEVPAPVIRTLTGALPEGRELSIVDVGAQALNCEEHIYQPLVAANIPCEIIGFDPLAHRLEERADNERGVNLKLYPFAIGDGQQHTLHVNRDDGTSSLYPINPESVTAFAAMSDMRTVRTEAVATRTLDDALGDKGVDFLKLDIQGFELRALEGAVNTLDQTAVVHCEVEFFPIYLNQPLFTQVYSFLTVHGFDFIDLVKPVRLSPPVPSGSKGPERLVFTDAVFFRRNPERCNEMPLVQAIVALLVYKKPVLAESLLRLYDGVHRTTLAERFAANQTG
jgi:FkbM family methyltransferase